MVFSQGPVPLAPILNPITNQEVEKGKLLTVNVGANALEGDLDANSLFVDLLGSELRLTTQTASSIAGTVFWMAAPETGRFIMQVTAKDVYGFYSVVQLPIKVKDVCGDANGDGKVTSADVTYLINYLLKGGPAPASLTAADANGDGKVTISDAVYLINYLFKGGPAPVCK
jgi:hypothetical protein